jgi:hypothetical protein
MIYRPANRHQLFAKIFWWWRFGAQFDKNELNSLQRYVWPGIPQ